MKKFHRILSALLCLAMLVPSVATLAFAVAPDMTRAATPSAPTELDSLSGYLHASVATEDNTSHLPVNVHTYYDANKTYTPNTIGVDGSVSILYVMNTNTERLGTKSDAELVESFLDRGFFVIVLDYMDNPAACGTDLDWSVQDIRCQVIGGAPFAGGRGYSSGTYTDGKLVGEDPICAKSYILPAGYDITYNVPYFSYDKHGVAGTFEIIVEIWNNDFKSVKRDFIVKWVNEDGTPKLDKTEAITVKAANDTKNVDYATWFKTADGKGAISQAQLKNLSLEEQKQYPYTYIGNTKVTEVTDCVKMDGSMIDLNLYFDIIYPAGVTEELPVMIAMSSNYTRTASWTGETRPYLNGPLFNGYVGIVSDYGLVPMCRNDHYGYFCGDSQLNSVSGDNATYSLSYYNGIHSDTALLRTLRKIGVDGLEIEGFGTVTAPINPEKIGAYGNSKGGVIVRLANPTPEKLAELRHADGHMGETRLEAIEGNYPYVDPYYNGGATIDDRIALPEAQPILTYNNGETIHSGLNFVFANCGGASNTLTEGSAPIFGVGTQSGGLEGSYYTYYATTANFARNLDIPFLGLVAPTIAHDLGYGLDKDYGIDIYGAFNRYANYWLADENAECMIVDVDTTKDIWVAADVEIDNVYEITEDSSIKLQFTGPIDETEIEKVKIISLSTGEELNGDWYGSYGNQQWKFIPYDIKDATYYTVFVPDSIVAANGKPLKSSVTHTFRTASGVTESALSVTTADVKIAEYDCVNRGFTLGAAGYALDQTTYKFNKFAGAGYGLQIDLRAIGATSGINNNQNVRLPIFSEIWADSSYIGKTIKFSFEAKASEAGSIKLALNQHENGNYVWGDGWGLISSNTQLTTEWQTYTYEFTVTEEMWSAKAQSTSTTPEIALGVRFSGFLDENGKYKGAQINFRNFTTYAPGTAGDCTLKDDTTPLFFNFEQKDYSYAKDITLRFAVTNDAANTVGIYAANGTAIGEKLGEVIVTGAGVYNFDVTDYLKSCTGIPTVAVKLENKVGSTIINNFNNESDATGVIGFNVITSADISDEAKNSDGTANNSLEYKYMVNIGQYVGLHNELVSKYTASLAECASSSNAIKGGAFNESDVGRRIRVSFRVYDETTRVVSVHNGYRYNIDKSVTDYDGTDYSFYTKAGEWVTVTYEFTIDSDIELGDILNKRLILIEAENKSLAILDEDSCVRAQRFVTAVTKPGNCCGSTGLNDSYVIYDKVGDAEAAGKITYYEDLSYSLFIDDLVVEEVATSVKLASTAPMLSITPTTAENNKPTTSDSVLSTVPSVSQDGLYISGGKDGFDTKSVKSYVKLSLDKYYGGYAAFYFLAKSAATANIAVYGVADVKAGESWESGKITSSGAPANDIYGSGVNVNSVFGNAPLATFTVGTSETPCLVEFTEYADAMAAAGATEITLIIVSTTKAVTDITLVGDEIITKIDEFDCINKGPATGAGGYTLDQSTYKFFSWLTGEDGGLQIDTRCIATLNGNQAARISIFKTIWTDTFYVGKTIRFTFRAKASEAGRIDLSLRQRQLYAFKDFPGFDGAADLTTEWQTFTFEFVVTQEMYDCITNGDDPNGIEAQGLALGVQFTDFSDNGTTYNSAQIVMRDFAVYTVEKANTDVFTDLYDMSATKPTVDTRGYGKQLATIIDGAIEIDLTKDSQAPNPNAYTRVTALDKLFADESNKGKTFILSFKAKATEAGVMDMAFNKFGSFNTYEYGGISYKTQYSLTTEYQTFTYTFTATEDMFTTHASTNLNLAFRLYNGFLADSTAYKAAQVYIDDIFIVENPYVRTVDYTYDMSETKPTVDTRGYGKQLATIVNGEIQIDLTKDSQAPNANAYTRVVALDQIFSDASNVGKTFSITFRAKATEAGVMDMAFNKFGSFNTYSYGGKTYNTSYSLTTEYQTFTYTFTVVEDMITTHASTNLNLAFRLYNGFLKDSTAYKAAQVYIDDIHVRHELDVTNTTLPITDSVAISGAGNSDKLTVYADDTATGAPEIYKSYFTYDLTDTTVAYGATLGVNLSGANGESVKVYVLSGVTLSSPLTWNNAPVPTGGAAATFTAKNGMNYVDIGEAIAASVGTNAVIILAIEEPSEKVEITAEPTLTTTRDYHNYQSAEQKHSAIAPTHTHSGNVEFYTCLGCEKLYVKSGDSFVEVEATDVFLAPVDYIYGAALNIGEDLGVRYYVNLLDGESITDLTAKFTMNSISETVTEAYFDEEAGMYAFQFSGIAPQTMGENIAVEIWREGELVDSKSSYSVKEYAISTMALNPDNGELNTLLADLLIYGAQAQRYIGYKPYNPVTNGVDLSMASTAVPTAEDNNKSASANSGEVKFTAAGVRFDYVNRIYVKIVAPSIEGVTVSVDGQNLVINKTDSENVYIAYSNGISALDFAEKLVFTLSVNGEAVQTLTYTVNDYALAKSGDAEIGELSLALYRYGKSTVLYAASVNN